MRFVKLHDLTDEEEEIAIECMIRRKNREKNTVTKSKKIFKC